MSYYSAIYFEKYVDINLFPKNYPPTSFKDPNNYFVYLSTINVEILNKNLSFL